ncbi:hypothetical protein ACFQDG_14820, partial [Natronoarchaeum mannanilyticum]
DLRREQRVPVVLAHVPELRHALAALLLALDAAVDLGGLLSMPSSGAPPGAAGALEAVTSALALVDLLLTLAWALPAVVALAFLVRYIVGRRPALRIEIAGTDDVVIPAGENPPLERLERALDFDES